MKKIVYIVGTRPEIIRSAFIILALRQDPDVSFKLVHTGQHYDYLMSDAFFKELGLSAPDVNLGVGSGSHGEQTAKMILKLERFFLHFKPAIVAVFGDTNSSLAGALAAKKLKIPVAHLEAGGREWEQDLPEEINRRLIDHCSDLLLAVSENCLQNLKKENVAGKIYNTGDPLYNVFKLYFKKSLRLNLIDKLGLEKGKYAFLTMHRDKNVDSQKNLKNILSALCSCKNFPIVFPVHPRTKKRLKVLNYPASKLSHFLFLKPLNYQETLHLLAQAKMVITDSGGLQKEAFWAKVPCITLRERTAWQETVDLEVNFLTGADMERIRETICYVQDNYAKVKRIFLRHPNPYEKRDTVGKIVKLLKEYAN